MIVDLAVSVGAFVAALAGVNLTARTVFAMAREGGMPRVFAWTHPRFGHAVGGDRRRRWH